MAIRAKVDLGFIRRFLYIAIGCFLFMLWGLYDGLVGSPKKLEAAKYYWQLHEQKERSEITEEQRSELWRKKAASNGWATAEPESVTDAENHVYMQWVFFGIGLVLGLFFLLKYLRLLNSWMEADDHGVTTSWGQSLKFDNIQQINKQKWEKKGIARITFQNENGPPKNMVFDDFKYDRAAMAQIMALAEKNLKDDQILGGSPGEKSQEKNVKPNPNVSE